MTIRTIPSRIVKFHVEMFQDERGGISIKPVVAYICMWFLCVTMIINSVANNSVRPSDVLVNSVMMLAMVGLGADSVDKFSLLKKGHRKSEEPDEDRYVDPEKRYYE